MLADGPGDLLGQIVRPLRPAVGSREQMALARCRQGRRMAMDIGVQQACRGLRQLERQRPAVLGIALVEDDPGLRLPGIVAQQHVPPELETGEILAPHRRHQR